MKEEGKSKAAPSPAFDGPSPRSSLIPHPASRRPLILGTAGHIDHGKTSLVKALTGIDADRLPEEKARGMTIDLGFAHLEIDGRRIGIVDVPGHERFIRNMVAGATGIDFVMLVVAADDAVMPQTREHLEIIDLLGVRGGLVALNKIDLATEERARSAEAEVRALLKGTCLDGAPIVRVSAVTGQGAASLKQAIGDLASGRAWPAWPPLFRLPIDRRFSLPGHGTILTGSLLGGDVKASDEAELMPQRRRVRVRSVESFGSEREGLESGRRVAVNIPGLKAGEVQRGNELAAPGYLRPSERIAVKVQCLKSAPLALSHRALLRLHIGTQSADARLALIGVEELEPGQSGYAILQSSEPVCGTHGQRFILRSSSHAMTVGGGKILCTNPPKVKSNAAPPEWIRRLDGGSEDERLLALLEIEPSLGGHPEGIYRETGVAPDDAERLLANLAREGRILRSPGAKGSAKGAGYWTDDYVRHCKSETLQRLSDLLEKSRPRLAVEQAAFLRATSSLGPPEFIHWILAQLRDEGNVRLSGAEIQLAGYRVELREAEKKDQERLLEVYAKEGLAAPGLAEAALKAGISMQKGEALFAHAVDAGELIPINQEMALHRSVHDRLLATLRQILQPGAGLTVSEIKDKLNVSRKFAIPICEYLDRRGYTRREGDKRYAGERLWASS